MWQESGHRQRVCEIENFSEILHAGQDCLVRLFFFQAYSTRPSINTHFHHDLMAGGLQRFPGTALTLALEPAWSYGLGVGSRYLRLEQIALGLIPMAALMDL